MYHERCVQQVSLTSIYRGTIEHIILVTSATDGIVAVWELDDGNFQLSSPVMVHKQHQSGVKALHCFNSN